MSKLIRILIGMPFVMIFWLGLLTWLPIFLLIMWIVEGHIGFFDKTYLLLPVKFVRYVWNN